MQHDFNAALARSRDTAEIPIANWFKKHGAHVLPGYAFSGNGAPKLEAFSASESLTIPDLVVVRAGIMTWVEVKLKSRATATYSAGGRLDTGLSKRLYSEYLRVQAATGAVVYLSFAHEEEDFVSLDEIRSLDAHPGKRVDSSDKMERGGMVFWPIRALRVVSTLAAVRDGRSPERPRPKPLSESDIARLTYVPAPVDAATFRAKAANWFRRELVREPPNNVYGGFKVLRRTDGLFTVHNSRIEQEEKRFVPGPVYATEGEARDAAHSMMLESAP